MKLKVQHDTREYTIPIHRLSKEKLDSWYEPKKTITNNDVALSSLDDYERGLLKNHVK